MSRASRLLPLFAVLLLATPAMAAAPALAALKTGFRPGMWNVSRIGEQESSGKPICVRSMERLLTAGRAGRACNFTVITDTQSEGVVHYRCEGGLSGRTVIRRDTAALYTIMAQGIEKGMPFAARTEWRRTGDC